jgi:hypothetical protein
MSNPHSVTWFEIPVNDLARATAFYSKVLDIEMSGIDFGPSKMSLFPVAGEHDFPVVHGALVAGESYEPGPNGPLIYLNGGADLSIPLGRVAAAGGSVVVDKTSLGEHGFMAIFLDTEGNRVGIHSDG